MRVFALILAGGEGKRFRDSLPKQFVEILGKTVLERSIIPFEETGFVDEIFVVVNPSYLSLGKKILGGKNFRKIRSIVEGGKTRQESVRRGLSCMEGKEGVVLIHDAVRPFISPEKIEAVIRELDRYNAVSLAFPVKETIGVVSGEMLLTDIPERSKLFSLQTPQGFKLSLIREAHIRALKEGFNKATDDCSLIRKYFPKEPVRLILGDERNIKITYPIDLKIAEVILRFKEGGLEK